MAEALTIEPIPLVFGPDGLMRVRGTRVTVETVLAAFAEGATAEEIAQQYPSISLADVYQVIGYCLRHSSELEPYLARRREDINKTRRSNESRWPPAGIRDRLLARRQG
jgi:uncharacterized protein (DUF433 family)